MSGKNLIDGNLISEKLEVWRVSPEDYQSHQEAALSLSKSFKKMIIIITQPKIKCNLCGQTHFGEEISFLFDQGKSSAPSSLETMVDSCQECPEFFDKMEGKEVVRFIMRVKRKMIKGA